MDAPLRSAPASSDEPVGLEESRDVLIQKLEQKQLELERLNRGLAEREARLRAIVSTEPECVKLMAADGTLLEMNPAGLRMIEADSFQQVDHQGICGLVDEEHRAPFRELIERVFRGESGTLEFRITGLKGGRRWLETHATPLRDASGAVSALLGITRDITQRKQVEETLRASERRYAALVGRLEGIVWEADAATFEFSFVSEFAETLLGYPLSSWFEPTFWRDHIHPEDRDTAMDFCLTSTARGEPHDFEYRMIASDGRTVWLRDLVTVEMAGGQPLTLRGVMVDITGRKRAEEELRAREERYFRQRNALIALTSNEPVYGDGLACVLGNITKCASGTLGVARVSIWRHDDDRSVIHCVDLYDLEAERHSSGMELSASSYPAYFRALEHVEVIAANDARTDARTSEFADSYLRPLGITSMMDAPLHVRGSVSGVLCHEHVGPVRVWTEDEKVFAVAIANLVSLALEGWERRRAEADLCEARDRLKLAVNAGKVGLWDRDLRANTAHFSPEWKQQIGYDEDQFPDDVHEWRSRVHPDDLDRVIAVEAACLSGAERSFEVEFRLRHKDGSYRRILSRGSTLPGDDGMPMRLVGSHVDITEWTELQAQFLQSQKMECVGQLAGGIAHDFNNLLTVINGTVDLVLSDLKDADPLREDLQQIRDAGDRAAVLTRQLLAFSRKQFMTPHVLDLNDVVSDMQRMLERLICEDIELAIITARSLDSVKADPGQIQQVIMNLAVNARDAMPDGGTLTIETRNVELDAAYASEHPSVQPGPHVMLAVSDTGIGMDESTRSRIFEPFFTTKGPARGTGLGLSTVYGIVKQSGGSIWVSSEPGQGTTFRIYLPQAGETADKDRPSRHVLPARGTETVLIVDDDVSVRQLAARFLESAGYTVVTAGSGADAQLLLDRHNGPVHLMLTDMVMPGMTGRELAERLASIHPRMKILYTSGYTDDTVLRHGVIDHAAHFIGKPYTTAELSRKVRAVLDSSDPDQ